MSALDDKRNEFLDLLESRGHDLIAKEPRRPRSHLVPTLIALAMTMPLGLYTVPREGHDQ